jgi:hypothetical protein
MEYLKNNNNFYKVKKYFNNINKFIIKNALFYKNLSSKLNKFNSSSSSIIKHPQIENNYLMNTRFVNYNLNDIGIAINNNNNCTTINKISILNSYFNEEKFKYLFPEKYNDPYIGIEDIRLFNFNNEVYFIGSSYNSYINKIQIVSNKFIFGEKYNPIFINPTFKTYFNWEKNWVFFNNNNKINIIYKWYPIYICEINYETQELNLIKIIDNLPSIFNKFRGSTNGIEYDNKIWFIVHQQNNIINNIKGYIHNFVVFDKNMKLLGFSKAFNFENKIIEYCIGFELTEKTNFLITYSTLDKTTKLSIFSPTYINSLIYYI